VVGVDDEPTKTKKENKYELNCEIAMVTGWRHHKCWKLKNSFLFSNSHIQIQLRLLIEIYI